MKLLSRYFLTLLLILPAFLASAQPLTSEPRPRLDCLDNPLPPGVLARLGTGRLQHLDDAVNFVAFCGDGKAVVSASDDSPLRLWEVETGKEIRQFNGHGRAILSLSVSPDGKTIASSGSDDTIRIWDTATGKELRRFRFKVDPLGLSPRSLVVAFSPDGKSVAAGINQRLQVLDIATGKMLHSPRITES